MAMGLIQVRIPEKIVNVLDNYVNKGFYSTKSDVIRDAIRSFILEKHIGCIPDTGNSVKEIREIRKKLSREKFDLTEINKLAD